MKFGLSIAALAVCSLSSAQSAHFIEVKGVREFSGKLIARPIQHQTLFARGLSAPDVIRIQTNARRVAGRYAVEYVSETDEYILKVPAGLNETAMANKLAKDAAFEYVEPDWTVYPLAIPNDPQHASQWHIGKVKAYDAWSLFTGATTNITVAITDTGVRLDHEDLASRLVLGANSATGTAIPQASGGLVDDINGHGTHCAGIAAASGNNGLGVVGAGWGLKIMPVRVTNSTGGSASISALTAGARWAAENGARVVSTSYSGVSSATVQTTGAYLRTFNTLYCWAAGNSNTNLSTFDHADVTIVGATDSADAKASFSSYGLATDIFAPGVNILSTIRTGTNTYGLMSGTSMATPLAAGIATTITASNPSLNSLEVQTALYQGCDDLGTPGEDVTFGWGRVNLLKSLQYAYNNYTMAPFQIQNIVGSRVSDPISSAIRSDNAYWRGGTGGVIRVWFDPTLLATGSMQIHLEDVVDIMGGGTATVKTASGVTGQTLATFSTSGLETVHLINVPLNAIDPATGDVVIDIIYTANFSGVPRWESRIDKVGLFTRP